MRLLHRQSPFSPLSSSLRRFYMSQPRIMSSPRDPTPDNLPPKRRRIHSMPPTITLSQQEETVRQLLVDVGKEIDRTTTVTAGDAEDEPIVLRFTGGWVRDKLLGIPSHDIDVGINKMTGFEFGNYLAGFLARNRDKYNIPPRAVHKIESNPEKSKHLETATTKILGLDIDLVNLRSETYHGDSRIPQMEFGTPVQDALRRDCTVNALFYNLHTQTVEDFTERGLPDMANKLIRTPLPPYETFDDDPLRVLRLIRFSSRLNFEIVPEVKEAMQHPDINTALRLKISRERIGTELEKMLKGTSPETALHQIHSLSLYTTIFAPPTPTTPPINLSRLPNAISALSHLLTSPTTTPNISSLLPTPHDIYLAWLLAALAPWEGYTFPEHAPKGIPGAATAAREGLRVNNRVFDTIVHAYTSLATIRAETTAGPEEWSRSHAGRFVRALGADWRSRLVCSLVLEMAGVWGTGEVEGVVERYECAVGRIRELGAEGACSEAPVVNGKEMCAALNAKPGVWMKGALDRVLYWQWDNPGLGKEEALEWAKCVRAELIPEGTEGTMPKKVKR